jgi:hypothetical protein
MTRFKRLKEGPEILSRLTLDELRQELAYWKRRIPQQGLPHARKGADKRVREIEREIEARCRQPPN